ncbi:hypothetical protein BBP18_13945 [Bacillus velezensis]|nr:hypothetical protein AS588_01405 [Bacillus amyloliquefaciens]ERK83443.1 hypothetical protein N786_10805 [Bacillus amyloliquefaciens UASWS BA1]KZE57141.1 hypothetical protein AV542_06665 [Bacillus amyloliquefaciens]PII41253.1 hypothetical protein BBP18_13945 [Bacillus velezensis]CCF06321.1 hypothetical protein BACAU_2787 [Bacillus velezensis CAU B946]
MNRLYQPVFLIGGCDDFFILQTVPALQRRCCFPAGANMYILIKNSELVMNAILIVPSAAYICRRTAFLPCFSSARFSPAQGGLRRK